MRRKSARNLSVIAAALLACALPARAQDAAARPGALDAEVESYLAGSPDLGALTARASEAGLTEFLASAGTGRPFGPGPVFDGRTPLLVIAADEGDAAAPAAPPPAREAGTLPETTVRAATLREQPLKETVPAVNIVTREKMDDENAQGIADALQWQPGLWTTQSSSATLGTPMIRGYQGNQVLFVLDGIRITHDRTPTGPGPDWENFNSDLIDRIEVLRSPDSVLYGTGAIGGVTAAYSIFPTAYPEEGKRYGGSGRYSVSAGGYDFWRLRGAGYAAAPGWRFMARGSVMRSQDMETPEKQLVPTAFDIYGAQAAGEWRLDPDNTLGATLYVTAKSWDGNFLAPERPRNQDLGREVGIVSWRNTVANGAWDELETRVGFVHNSQKYERTDILDVSQYDIYTVQVTALAHKRVADAHDLTYGLDSHVDFVDVRRRKASGLLREVPKGTITYIGALAQDQWRINDPLLDPAELKIDQSDAAFTGKLGVLYDATEEISFTANYSRGYRHPSITDLAGLLQAPDEIVVGNPDAKPEYSNNFEVGAHYATPTIRADLVGFYTRNSNALIRTYGTVNGMEWYDRNGDGIRDSDEDFYLTQNAGKFDFWGIELSAQADVLPWMTVFGNLTTWNGDIEPDPTEPIGIPNNMTLGVRLHHDNGMWAEFVGHFVARFDDIPQDFYDAEAFFKTDPQDESSPTLRNDHSVPGYSLFDFRAGMRIAEKSTLTFGVSNIFNRKYRSFGDRRDGAARTFYLSLEVGF